MHQRCTRYAATGRGAPAAVLQQHQRHTRTCLAVPNQRCTRRAAMCSATSSAVRRRRQWHNARDEVRQCSGVCGAQRRAVPCQQRWTCGTSGTHPVVQLHHISGVSGPQRRVVMYKQQCDSGTSGAHAPLQLHQNSGVRGAQRHVVLYKQRCASGTSCVHARVRLCQNSGIHGAQRCVVLRLQRRDSSTNGTRTSSAVPDQRRPRYVGNATDRRCVNASALYDPHDDCPHELLQNACGLLCVRRVSLCACVCVRACVRACVCTFVCAFARASVHACSGGGGGGGGGRDYCGGRGGCTYASSDTPCGRVDKRCVDALFYPKPMCDGNGTCVSLAAIPCLGGYACSADERRCRTDCTSITVTPPHCQSMHYCNVAASACTPKRGDGGPCPDGRRPARCVRQRPLRSRRVLRPAVQRSAVPVLRPHVACVLALWTRAVRSFPSHACPCACMHGCVRACVCVCVRVRVRVRELVYVCRDARTCA